MTRRQPANKVVRLGLCHPVGRGHGPARGRVDTGEGPSAPSGSGRGGAAGPPPTAHRGAATTAPSPPDQRGPLADRRARAGRVDDRGLRPWAAGACRGRDGRRRCGGPMAWSAAGARAGGDLAGAGGPQLLVGPQRTVVRAAAGPAGPAPLSAPDRPGDPCPAAELACRERRGSVRSAPAAVRGGRPDGLGRGAGATPASGSRPGSWR